MDNNMTYPIGIEHIKSFVKKHLPYMITLVVPVIYFLIMLPGAEKMERSGSRSGYRCGYRPRRLDTQMGTMYLMVPKVR